MMRRRLAVALGCTAFVLTGCAGTASPPAPTSAPPAATTEPAPVETEHPTASAVVTLSSKGLTPEGESLIEWDQGKDLLAFVTELLGSPTSTVNDQADPLGNLSTQYVWPEVVLFVPFEGESHLIISGSSEAATFASPSGLHVGSSRDDIAATDATLMFSDPTVGDIFADGLVDAPGTDSLIDVGEDGHDYVELLVKNDVVTKMTAPASDYRDL